MVRARMPPDRIWATGPSSRRVTTAAQSCCVYPGAPDEVFHGHRGQTLLDTLPLLGHTSLHNRLTVTAFQPFVAPDGPPGLTQLIS